MDDSSDEVTPGSSTRGLEEGNTASSTSVPAEILDDDVYRQAVAAPPVEIGALAAAFRSDNTEGMVRPAASVVTQREEAPEVLEVVGQPPAAQSVPEDPPRYQGRLGGLDIARALAIFGMFYAHVGPVRDFSGVGAFLDGLPDGRSSILFAILAGISLSILTGRNVPYGGDQMRTARLRIIGRSCVLMVIAGLLSLLGVPVAIILACYAAWFIASLPMTRWNSRRLFVTAGVLAFVGPTALNLFVWIIENLHLWPSEDANGFVIDVFFMGTYPGVVYMAYVIAGMGLGRLDLTLRSVQARLVAIGSVLAAAGYGAAWLVSRIFSDALNQAPNQGSFDPSLEGIQPWLGLPFPDIHFWAGAEPHSHTIFEVIGSGGFGIAVLGVCLLIGGLSKNVLYPLAAVGSMSLTAYSAHIVVIAFNMDWNGSESWFPILALVVGCLVLCTAWKFVSQRGPLEWLMWKVSMMVSHMPAES